VDPRFRRQGVGDRLLTAARGWCAINGADLPVLVTALAGNGSIERRVPGPRGQPLLTPIGTVRVYAVAPLGPKAAGNGLVAVRGARPTDAEEMADLWQLTAAWRQGAAVMGAGAWRQWLSTTPGLSWGDYLLAADGKQLVGFVGLWDQRALKQTLVIRYSAVTALARGVYNAAGMALGRPLLPGPGGALHALHAVHLCVPAGRPEVLRALLWEARRRCHVLGVPALEVGLDRSDPLARALGGMPRIGTDVRCFLSSAAGRYAGPPLDGRPIHFETALV